MRSLIRSPRYTMSVVLTLAFALAANTALFSVADALLLRQLPYQRSDRLAVLYETRPVTRARTTVSAPAFLSLTAAVAPDAALAAFRPWGFVLTGNGEPERLTGARISANLFPLLGVTPLLGRAFDPSEDVFGAPRVAIVSYRIWQERLDGAGDLTGLAISLDGTRYSVVGVMPPDFQMPLGDVWLPLAFEPFALQQRGTRALTVIARLGDGVSMQRVHERLASAAADLSTRFPDSNRDWSVDVVPLREYVSGTLRPTVLLLWGAVALLLVIACANTASLMLARVSGRRRQIAICRAIGAPRWRLIRDLLAESATLALMAGLFAIPIARVLLALLVHAAPPELSRLGGVDVNSTALAFTAGLAALTGLLFGLVPALRMSREDFSPLLRSTGSIDGGQGRLRQAAVAFQLAVAAIVLIGGGLLTRSLDRVQRIDPGFDPSDVLTMSLSSTRPEFFEDVLQHTRTIAGVAEVGLISHLPLAGVPLAVAVEGADRGMPGSAETVIASCSAAAGDWTQTLRIPLLRGRTFTSEDTAGGALTVIVSAKLARRLWGIENPIGRQVRIVGGTGANPAPRQVVGVVGDVRSTLETAPGFQVYLPYVQAGWPTMSLVARTARDPSLWTREVRSAVLSVDRNQAIYNVRSFDQILARARATRSFQAVVVWVFAAFAISLAVTGVHGIIAFTVRQRAAELGLRIALGASRSSVLGVVMRTSVQWGVGGLVSGLAFAAAGGRVLQSMLYEISPVDPATFLAGSIAMIVLLVGASIAAAWRATTIDPLVSIRGEYNAT